MQEISLFFEKSLAFSLLLNLFGTLLTSAVIQDMPQDSQLEKWSCNFWKGAGRIQAALGELTGMEQWRTAGEETAAWAEACYRDAEARQQAGEPSWYHGEYERLMGKLGYVVGHVAGDPEMQAKAQMRAHQGEQEIHRYKQ